MTLKLHLGSICIHRNGNELNHSYLKKLHFKQKIPDVNTYTFLYSIFDINVPYVIIQLRYIFKNVLQYHSVFL